MVDERAPRWGGTVPMTEARYQMIAGLIGPSLSEIRCEPIPINSPSGDEQKALYVIVNHAGYICYGGRTSRQSSQAASKRIRREHLQDAAKRENWSAYWVFPLKPDTSTAKMRQLEREMVSRLGLSLVRYARRGR